MASEEQELSVGKQTHDGPEYEAAKASREIIGDNQIETKKNAIEESNRGPKCATESRGTQDKPGTKACEALNENNECEQQKSNDPNISDKLESDRSSEGEHITSEGIEDDENIKKTEEGENDDQEYSLIDDDGDPIPSGTGAVSRDCSASELIGWSEILPKWHSNLNQRPKGLATLVKNGVPEPLRGEVWQLLSGVQQCSDLMDQYRILLTKSAPSEQIILRDVHRTYPAHENFRSDAGSASLLDSLFKVCKAYAVYDEEVGYCQGLSFLVAALLLHMPEEQAFCVFVRIMKHYGLRDLFRDNFNELYLKFYQLERLLEDNMPDLYQHFSLIGIEPFTYASQWFLTVFTAKFPLNAVFYILDVFLLDGMNTIFQIALALLQSSKQELLSHDFEDVLKYFRVQMPKRYRNQENVQQLIAASSTISLKKLSKHAKSYEVMKQKERLLENPISRLQRENAKLTENNLRLEQENDDLARDLVASKIQLRAQLDVLEDKAETLNRALTYSRQDCQSYLNTISDMEDERSRLEVEVSQLKEVCRRELNRAETELARDNNIISDYKKICSNMSKRLDYRLKCAENFIATINDSLRNNESCTERKCQTLLQEQASEFIEKIKSDDKTLEEANTTEFESPSRRLSRESLQRKAASNELDYANRPVGALLKSLLDSKSTSSEVKIKQLTGHIDELEVELARTKLALVEAECKCQQLSHDLNAGVTVKMSGGDNDQNQQRQQAGGLTGKLDFMRAAVGSATRKSHHSRATNTTGSRGAFSKLNNLISERISNVSQSYQYYQPATNNNRGPSSLPLSSSTPSFASELNGGRFRGSIDAAAVKTDRGPNNNANEAVRATILEYDQNKC